MATLQTTPTEAPPLPRTATVSRPLFRPHVIAAVCGRNFAGYFSNPAGYVFIFLFVLISSWVAFWQPAFFTNNLANLDTLNEWMPYLLLFFIPAVTMTAWAEERRQGTDELLLTLPALDFEVVMGKYLAAFGIYTVALLFSLSHIGLLLWLGRPDLGVMAANYFGYWMMGSAMISISLVASMLTNNVTVAFILGALFCAVPVFLEKLAAPFGTSARHTLEVLSIPAQSKDFGLGLVTLSGVVYFKALTWAMLFLNVVLLGRRHWRGGKESSERWIHGLVRVASVVIALISLNVLATRSGLGLDLSEAGLNTLSTESRTTLKSLPEERPVYIQAYYSPEVPREFVQTKNDLISLLRQYAARGGSKIRLNLVETELYSDEARDAQKRFGIEPRRVMTVEEAKTNSNEIILGVAFTSGAEEVVIPFFDRGLPVEYELTRSIRVVSKSGRKKVGILSTDAKLLGGFNFQTMGSNPEWNIVTELKKSYEVSSVTPDAPIPTDLDVVLVAQPSSMSQPQIDNLVTYVRTGAPTLLMVDPLPIEDPTLSPEVPKQPPGGPFGGGQPPTPKGDITTLMQSLGVDWPTTEIVWDPYNPHRQFADMAPEIIFVSRGDAGREAFNPEQPITKDLQEVVMMFAGRLRPRGGSGPDFIPLLKTGDSGGTLNFSEVISPGMFGPVGGIRPNRRHFPSRTNYTLAARLTGKAGETRTPPSAGDKPDGGKINAIVVADLDVISDQFFQLRRQKRENLDFDNVTFILNCVDVLASDEAFVGLRSRRPMHRTLTRLESEAKAFIGASQEQAKQAEDAATELLEKAKKRLTEKVAAVSARKDVDERTSAIMVNQLQEVENRRLAVETTNIEDQKKAKIAESKMEMERQIRGIENRVRSFAIFIPPLPALLLGIGVFFLRLRDENRGAVASRLA